MNFALLAIAAIMLSMRKNERIVPQDPKQAPEMKALISRLAVQAGVPVPVALATAWLESRFNPNAEGDLLWHTRDAKFEAAVPKNHPFRSDRALWHSYGLFQLLAPYHVKMNENPLVLLDPEINAQRGIAFLARLMRKHAGNVDAVRLAYTGQLHAAADSKNQLETLERWHSALAKFGYSEPIV